MRERGFIDDDLEEEDMIQIPKYYKEIRGLGLFQPNPEKGWGPKKMVWFIQETQTTQDLEASNVIFI